MSDRRTLLVTGASAGIGAAVAREAARLGWRTAIGARRLERLAELREDLRAGGAEVFAHTLDVSREDSVDAFFEARDEIVSLVWKQEHAAT